MAQRWGVRDAAESIDAVLASVKTFAEAAKARGVKAANVAEIAADIERRVGRLQG